MPFLKQIPGCQQRTIHHAKWILVNPDTIVRDGFLVTENHQIKNITTTPPDRQTVVEHGAGVIMPQLVNAHVHLELSALHGQLPFDRGFEAWVAKLLEKREGFSDAQLIKYAQKSLLAMNQSGTGYVGEISTLNLTADLLTRKGVRGVFFCELIGEDFPEAALKKEGSLSFSLAGHAPHSCAPDLLCAIKEKTKSKELPFSIHLAESAAESEFIATQKGSWAQFLTSRGIDWESWDIQKPTPVSHLFDLGILDELTLAVHLIRVDEDDLKLIKQSGAKICVCPRSNMNLHGCLPDIEKMIEIGLCPAIGTDSLASCTSLNLFDEMAFLKQKFPGISYADIVAMATLWGAKALGLQDMAGTLDPGKDADCIYLEMDADSEDEVLEKVVNYG